MTFAASAAPMIGRTTEFADVLGALSSTSVVLFGPAGIGKTRLAGSVTSDLERQGVVVRRIRAASSERSIPLLVLAPLLGPTTDGAVEAIHRTLGLGSHRPGAGDPVVFIDDANFLDERSVAVLGQLLDAGRVRLLATVRTEAVDASAGDLGAFRLLLRRDDVARRTISSLPDADLAELAGVLIGGSLDGRSSATLVRSAAGNPLLLRELILGARTSGALVDRGGLWVLNASPAATPVLDELVRDRVALLDGEARNAVELLAVAGRVRLELFTSVVSLGAVELLERVGLIAVSDHLADSRSGEPPGRVDPMIDLAHPIYRDVLLQRLRPLARLRCHRELVTMASSVENPSPEDELQVAVWQMLGGAPMAAEPTLRAAKRALQLRDTALAGDLAVLSYRAAPSADAAILACWSLATTGRQKDADSLAIEAQGQLDDPIALSALVLRRAEERWWWAQDCVGARAILTQGIASLPVGPWVDLLRVQEGVFAALDGDCHGALSNGRAFIDHEFTWVRRNASIGLGFGLLASDRNDESVAVAERAFNEAGADPAHELSGDPAIHVMTLLFAGLYGPDAAATLTLAETVYAVAVQQPSPQPRGWAALMLSLAQLSAGCPLSAARSAREAELIWLDVQIAGLARWSATALGLSHLAVGDTTAAAEALERVDSYACEGFRLNEPQVAIIRAGLAAATGDPSRAADLLAGAARDALSRGALVNAVECVHHLVRFRAGEIPDALLAEVRAACSEASGPLIRAQLTLLEGFASRQWAQVEAAADQLAASGRRLLAAEAYALAAGALEPVDRAASSRCGAASSLLLTHCETARTPLVTEASPADRLSGCEREVSRLAVSGLTNKEIAERLVVSERTVESHLYRVFAKLGIRTRAELASRLPSV